MFINTSTFSYTVPLRVQIAALKCDESMYWMELLRAMRIGNDAAIAALMEEAGQILSIIVASIRTARTSIRNTKIVNRQS
jgi:hypothetical protein